MAPRALFKPLLLLMSLLLTGCASQPPIRTEPRVDIPRFMGTWYVIAHIPVFLEKNAWNATETYTLEGQNIVRTTFRFNEGAFDGPERVFKPTGFVDTASGGGLWGMQFLWPFKAEYRIVHLSKDYQQTIIGHSAREYVWIMARTPTLAPADYEKLVRIVAETGHDTRLLRRVPQKGSGFLERTMP